jgi:aspartokinase
MSLQKHKGHRRGNGKRNCYQIAEDTSTAIELMRQGKTYDEIAQIISQNRIYSLSRQQIQKDLEKVRWDLIAKTTAHVGVVIGEELDSIEGVATRAIEALNATIDKEKINPQLLRVLLDCGARKSYLLGVDCYIKQQNINAAIETLTRAGFNVSDPSLVGGGQEPIDVEAN